MAGVFGFDVSFEFEFRDATIGVLEGFLGFRYDLVVNVIDACCGCATELVEFGVESFEYGVDEVDVISMRFFELDKFAFGVGCE